METFLRAFWHPKAIKNTYLFLRFFCELPCATGARCVNKYGKNNELALWSGAPSFKKRDHKTTLRSLWTASSLSLALETGLQGHFARDLTRPGPLARRISVTFDFHHTLAPVSSNRRRFGCISHQFRFGFDRNRFGFRFPFRFLAIMSAGIHPEARWVE